MTEAWLRGPVEGVPDALMPAAHSLLDALEDMERAASPLTVEQLWMRPGGAASVGFHLRHVGGSVERLLTYARGASLTTHQLAAISLEGEPGDQQRTAAELLAALRVSVIDALNEYRTTPPEALLEARSVGRAGLPSTVQGLLFHAAEHARRHAGQVIATAGIIKGLGLCSDEESTRVCRMIRVKRIYDPAGPEDGTRILVDRLWPRGIAKSASSWTHWMKELAPSSDLRRWFGHDPRKWGAFLLRYHEELNGKANALALLFELVGSGTVTLLHAARDERCNNAVALKEYLDAAKPLGLGVEHVREAIRSALVEAAVEAHHDAGVRGLCAEGRWDVAIDAMKSLDLRHFMGRARTGQGES